MGSSNAEWVRPELVTVSRNRPEETVLLNCKLDYQMSEGFSTMNVSCQTTYSCTDCSALAES